MRRPPVRPSTPACSAPPPPAPPRGEPPAPRGPPRAAPRSLPRVPPDPLLLRPRRPCRPAWPHPPCSPAPRPPCSVFCSLVARGARRRGGYARGEATASVSSHPRPPPQAPCPPSRGSPALGVRGTPAAPGILAPAAVVRRVAPAAPTCAGRSGWPCAAGRRP